MNIILLMSNIKKQYNILKSDTRTVQFIISHFRCSICMMLKKIKQYHQINNQLKLVE